MVAGHEDGAVLLDQHGAYREAVAEPFRQRHDVGLDAEVLVGEQRARPPDARLHLVEDQQQVLLVAPGAHLPEVVVVGDDDAAFALDRLQQHGAGLLGGRSLDGLRRR